MPGYPSIQSILSVTGTIDIDKFNRGFEENIEGAEDSTEHTLTKSKAKEETRPVKRPRLLSVTEPIVDTEDISESRKPVSLWFKKQLVIQLVKESKMDLSAYGYTGETDSHAAVGLVVPLSLARCVNGMHASLWSMYCS